MLFQTLFLFFALICQPAIQLSYPSRHFKNYPSRVPKASDLETEKYKYHIKTIELPVDHFSFSIQDTFKLRYLTNDTWEADSNAPIFFYTGNEGDIETFAQNTGFMWDIAPHYQALLIFAEHRYYGESLPYGNKSYSDRQHLGYLTSEQALADYVDLMQYFRSQPKYKESPIIVFGGSYGGMLSAWIRIKYPHIVQGAIAASAPILQFTGFTTCEAFARIVTSDFAQAHEHCPKLIRKSWSVIDNATSTDEGKKWLSNTWKLCQPLKNSSDINEFKSFLEDVYGNLAMVNYPYPANFLAPLPAYPIDVVCRHLTNISLTGNDLLIALHNAISVYSNYTGEAKCLQIEDAAPNLGASGWNYQACTEMVMPMCTDGVNDMFEPAEWNLDKYSEDCTKKYSVKPQPNLICQEYGCSDLSSASNIIFSNGLMDPWSSGGVLRNLSSSAIAILIPEGAHHLDLRGSNMDDPYSVRITRKYHRFFISRWIEQYRQREQRTILV